MPVIDASVWVGYYNEADLAHAQCSTWIEAAIVDGTRLVAPSLVMAEVAGALTRLDKPETVTWAIDHLTKVGVELIELDLIRARRAADVAAATRVRGADAVYLALAEERGDVLVTLDRQQRERGGALVEVREP
jgi:predicted nucleic acid-binding protein